MENQRVLFVCKRRLDFYGISVGLVNSAVFAANALNANGIEAKVVCVVDNNAIDKEIVQYRPTVVIIEALWVVPEKFNELCKIHPTVKFVVRIHSKTPFLAMEGVAISWIKGYKFVSKTYKNMFVSANSRDLDDDLKRIMFVPSIYLPNIYMPVHPEHDDSDDFQLDCDPSRGPEVLDIGCFGAIRPLKNQLIQALAAIRFAEDLKKRLRFHINANRIEQKADEVLKNLRALFAGSGHELVEHPWMSHSEFIKVVKQMQIGMQVSLSESFNIVAADCVASGVPIVVSHDVDWAARFSQADPNSTDDILEKLHRAYHGRMENLQNENTERLNSHNHNAIEIWLNFLQ